MLTARRDAGFTLIELLLAVVVLGIVMVGLVSVMFVALNANAQTSARLDASRDEQVAAAYFSTDAQAATTILTSVTAGCGTGVAAVEFRGISYQPSTYIATVTVVSYVFATRTVGGGTVGVLRRQSCEVAAAPAPTYPLSATRVITVARNLSASTPLAVCTPPACGPSATSVTLSAQRTGGDASFLLTGTRRTTL